MWEPLIERQQLVNVGCKAEPGLHQSPANPAHLGPECRVPGKDGHRSRQRAPIAPGNHKPGSTADSHLTIPTYVGGDKSQTMSRCFEQRVRQPFVPAGQDADIAPLIERTHILHLAHEADSPMIVVQARRRSYKSVSKGTVADEDQFGIPAVLAELRERPKGGLGVLSLH
jgi:hypothetical protein